MLFDFQATVDTWLKGHIEVLENADVALDSIEWNAEAFDLFFESGYYDFDLWTAVGFISEKLAAARCLHDDAADHKTRRRAYLRVCILHNALAALLQDSDGAPPFTGKNG